MSTHTPGPWTIDSPFTSITAGTIHVADAYHAMHDLPSHPLTLEQGQANARLIAAAPDMLDLAHNVGGLDDHVVTYGDIRTLRDLIIEWRDTARAVIAKAEGAS